MSESVFYGFAGPFEDDPLGPFGTGPAVADPDPLYVDEVYAALGDYDAFGPFADRERDFFDDLADLEKG